MVIAYFNKNKQSELTTDASVYGLLAILSNKVINELPLMLVDHIRLVKQRYFQTE